MNKTILKILKLTVITVIAFTVIIFGGQSILKTLYPTRYSNFVEKFANENNLQTAFVYAVIECESGFDKDAVSYADAKGLMQITPETFKWLQKKKGETLKEEMLFDPETNIEYGCYFYGILLKEYKNEATAVAAYHAGMGNVSKWLEDEKYSRDGKTLYDIPFKNTKKYVEKVTKTKNIYLKLYK